MGTRAHREVMWYLTQFCITNVYHQPEGKRNFPSLHGFFHEERDHPVERGDMVIPTATPINEWYVSWLLDIEHHEFGRKYLLKSLETENECWWENVGIKYLDREELAQFPQWRWSDRQYKFNDRWMQCCRKRDAYITLPVRAVFMDGLNVTLGTRTRFGWDDHKPTKTFPDWRKVTKKDMFQFYDWCVSTREKKT